MTKNILGINSQIAFLRRQAGLTQEELAARLGVSGQAVSKWESGQCCPDISLLCDIAQIFGVSTDELLGRQREENSGDISLILRRAIENAEHGEDFERTLRLAYTLHAVIFSKAMTSPDTGVPGWDTDDAVEQAGKSEWGLSCMNIPQLTTALRGGSVFFSNNKPDEPTRAQLCSLADVCRDFSELKTLKVLFALYSLTVHDENAYASLPDIASACALDAQSTEAQLDGALCKYLRERGGNGGREFRLDGMYMHLPPLLVMLIIR